MLHMPLMPHNSPRPVALSQVSFRLDGTLAKLDIIHCTQQREAKHHLVFSKASTRADVVPAAK